MDGDEIGLVLARALDIRSKIDQCITRSVQNGDGDGDTSAESLRGIRGALDSLESHLAELQALQQQQRYERETVLTHIDRVRIILLSKLREYKGKDMEVLHEAAAFAGEKIEQDDGLLLPPYPNHLPDLFAWNDFDPCSQSTSNNKLSQNGKVANSKLGTNEAQNNRSRSTSKGLRGILGFAAKSVITIVGLISVLSLAGYQAMIKRGPVQLKTVQLFGSRPVEVIQSDNLCPPGKVLVIEDGKTRCLVKERVQVPFESNVRLPDIKYGFG